MKYMDMDEHEGCGTPQGFNGGGVLCVMVMFNPCRGCMGLYAVSSTDCIRG